MHAFEHILLPSNCTLLCMSSVHMIRTDVTSCTVELYCNYIVAYSGNHYACYIILWVRGVYTVVACF